MDLQHTAPILMSRDIRVLHLEPTNVCQAACPLCPRETNPEFDASSRCHLTMAQILHVLGADLIRGLDKMFMCGNYGDPAAGMHTLDIYQGFQKLNPGIVLGMNSNGGLQNSAWWRELARIMSGPEDYVVFSIDGLENTNALYRVNVAWNRVMDNAQAFIDAGGSAHWDMLIYQHNQHQVDEAQSIARKIGFSWFRAKVSKRQPTGQLKFPVGWLRPNVESGPIQCHALRERSLYLDAWGRLHPCCWLGSSISRDPVNFDEIQMSWQSQRPETVCVETCTANQSGSSFSNQWQRNVALR